MLGAAAFFRYARERHATYLRRAAGLPPPWTDDQVLQQYRFCNVFREKDTVTQWIHVNIRTPYAEHEHLWLMLAVARTLNWPPTLAALMDFNRFPGAWPSHEGFSPVILADALDDLKASGVKVYTGAYMVRAESRPDRPWYNWTKQRYIGEVVIGRLWEHRALWQEALTSGLSLQDAWYQFQNPFYVGWGPFMAYEVVTDLRHTRYLRGAPDIMTWANPGPGALRGASRVRSGGSLVRPLPRRAEALDMMSDLLAMSQDSQWWPQWGHGAWQRSGYRAEVDGADAGAWPAWEMRDVEHTLCEYDKWERASRGEGRPRAKFHGGGHAAARSG